MTGAFFLDPFYVRLEVQGPRSTSQDMSYYRICRYLVMQNNNTALQPPGSATLSHFIGVVPLPLCALHRTHSPQDVAGLFVGATACPSDSRNMSGRPFQIVPKVHYNHF